eukprot:Opistho-2@59509
MDGLRKTSAGHRHKAEDKTALGVDADADADTRRGAPIPGLAGTDSNITIDGVPSAHIETIQMTVPGAHIEDGGVTISCRDLSYYFDKVIPPDNRKDKMLVAVGLQKPRTEAKFLLDNLNFSIRPKTMIALMGPSGAGKTTLLDVIAGLKNTGTITGDILFNGEERPRSFKRITGYVQQTNVLPSTLTVWETLYYTALLKLEEGLSDAAKRKRVDEVVALLGLGKCRETVIGSHLSRGISGGQAKRVTIGIELIHNPLILFLDEPTTGLDSATSYDVMKQVRKIADTGKSVVCTIHQPSTDVFAMFDKLLLLVAGRLVYLGKPMEAIPYFEKFGFPYDSAMNPADYLISVTGPGTGHGTRLVDGPEVASGFFAEEYVKSTLAEAGLVSAMDAARHRGDPKETKLREEAPSFVTSFAFSTRVMLRRSFKMHLREPTFLSTRIYQNVLTALIMLSIYYNLGTDATGRYDRVNVLFFMVTVAGLSSFKFLSGMFEERALFIRERSSGTYRVSSYFVTLWLTEFPFSVISLTLFSLIVYFGVGLNLSAGRFFYFVIIMILTQEVGLAFAQTFAGLSSTFEGATALCSITLTLYMLMSGYLINLDNIPNYWIWAYYTNFMAYALNGLIVNEFSGQVYGGVPGSVVIDDRGADVVSQGANVAILCGLMAAFRSFAYLGMRFVRHDQR